VVQLGNKRATDEESFLQPATLGSILSTIERGGSVHSWLAAGEKTERRARTDSVAFLPFALISMYSYADGRASDRQTDRRWTDGSSDQHQAAAIDCLPEELHCTSDPTPPAAVAAFPSHTVLPTPVSYVHCAA